jgi:adenylate cyclase
MRMPVMDGPSKLSTWMSELRRRKVVRVAVVYLVVAWLLIQVAGATFEPLGLPTWSIRLVIVLVALGFPVVLALAWAFDVTPRGIERTGTAPANDSSGSELKGTTAGEVTPVATSAAATPSMRDSAKSLAILPFADLSAERDQDYFCDGIAEEIINALCSIRGLKIASRTSAFQFKGKSADVREIGRTLGVDSVLEGSVRKAGDRVRITAQLIGAGDGYHLWSESFDRRLEDIFEIQREIAQQIVRCLKRNLQSADEQKLDRGGTTNIDAYEFYLRGRAMLRGHGAGEWSRTMQMFRRSIEIDPGFALAHAGFATALADNIFWHPLKNAAEIAEALQASTRAEELQPGLAEVMVARGTLLSAQNLNDEATAAYEEALERGPNLPDVYYWYARHAFSTSDFSKAARLFERNVELDPTNFTACGLLAQVYESLGDSVRSRRAYERCAEVIDRQLEIYPDDARAMQFGASANAFLGRRERALTLIERSLVHPSISGSTLYNCACGYARLGETDKALGLLERWVETGTGSAGWVRADRDLDSLRESPRFTALVTRLEHGKTT